MPNRIVHNIIADRPPLLLGEHDTVVNAVDLMTRHLQGAVMIVRDERLVGIFTERDLMNRVVLQRRDPATTRLAEVMTREPRSVTPQHRFGYALHLMHAHGYRHMPVAEAGRPIGMVSLRDVLGSEKLDFEKELEFLEHVAEVL
jgi:CBS domain-containing protein